MNIILIQEQLSTKEMDQLLQEFPHYIFLSLTETGYKTLSPDIWATIEIIYGNRLTAEELALAQQLRWIHSQTPNLNRLCLREIEEQGNILITNTKEENIAQVGEYAMSIILGYAKNLFNWRDTDQHPNTVWDSKWRDNMWFLENRTLLQIGLGKVGTEITRRARMFGMKVWGAQTAHTFHPHCLKTFSMNELDNALPNADVVSICLPRNKEYVNWLNESQLEMMKDDAILLILGSHQLINEDALYNVAKTKKFRGIVIDALYQTPIPVTSKLWKIPNILITPEMAYRPKTSEKASFRNFRYNLRQYMHGNFNDMRNLVDQNIAIVT